MSSFVSTSTTSASRTPTPYSSVSVAASMTRSAGEGGFGAGGAASTTSAARRSSLNPFRSTSRDHHPSFDDCFSNYHSLRLASLGETPLNATPQQWNPRLAPQHFALSGGGGGSVSQPSAAAAPSAAAVAQSSPEAREPSPQVGGGRDAGLSALMGVSAISAATPEKLPPMAASAPEAAAHAGVGEVADGADFSYHSLDLSGDSDTSHPTNPFEHNAEAQQQQQVASSTLLTPPRPIERDAAFASPQSAATTAGSGEGGAPYRGAVAEGTPMVTPRRGSGFSTEDVGGMLLALTSGNAQQHHMSAGGAAGLRWRGSGETPLSKPPLPPGLSPITVSPPHAAAATTADHPRDLRDVAPAAGPLFARSDAPEQPRSDRERGSSSAASTRRTSPHRHAQYESDSGGGAVPANPKVRFEADPRISLGAAEAETLFPLFVEFLRGVADPAVQRSVVAMLTGGHTAGLGRHGGGGGEPVVGHKPSGSVWPSGGAAPAPAQSPERVASLLVPDSADAAGAWSGNEPLGAAWGAFPRDFGYYQPDFLGTTRRQFSADVGELLRQHSLRPRLVQLQPQWVSLSGRPW